jgi:hypothetical protein
MHLNTRPYQSRIPYLQEKKQRGNAPFTGHYIKLADYLEFKILSQRAKNLNQPYEQKACIDPCF